MSLNVLSRPARSVAVGPDLAVRLRVWTTTGSAATSLGPAASAAVPRLVRAGTPARRKAGRFWVALLRCGARGADVLHQGGPLVGEAAQVLHRRPDLAQGLGELLQLGLEVVAALGGGLAGDGGVAEEAGDAGAVLGQRLQHRVAVAGEAGELVVLVGEDLQHAVGLAQGGVGAVDDLAEVVAAGREAGAEVVEDEPEAVAVGGAVDVLDQVEVDGLAVVLQRQQALALPRSRPRSPPARAAAG